jgi:hypothetical protein
MMSVEQSVEWELTRETEIPGEHLPKCHFHHHKSHLTYLGSNPGRRGGKPAINRRHLPLVPALASAVILGAEPRGTHDHVLLSQIRDSPNLEGQVPVFISPRHWVPFSSPPTTRRATWRYSNPPPHRHRGDGRRTQQYIGRGVFYTVRVYQILST